MQKKNTNIDNASVSTKILKQIRTMLLEDGISLKTVSQKMRISLPAVSGLLKQDNVTLNKLQEICNACGYTLDVSVSRADASATHEQDIGITQEQLQRMLAYAVRTDGSNVDTSTDSSNVDSTE